MTLSLTEIKRRLAAYKPPRQPAPTGLEARRAAVAIILRAAGTAREGVSAHANADHDSAGDTEILFIRRAEKTGDPWSGHMAFPGGHVDTSDASFLDAAIRETREEIGVDLEAAGQHIGTLPSQQPMLSRNGGLFVAPFVFTLTQSVVCCPNHEVAEVVWSPLAPIINAQNHIEEARRIESGSRLFSGYQLNDAHFVWGLTYRMLHSLFAVVDPDWREPVG